MEEPGGRRRAVKADLKTKSLTGLLATGVNLTRSM
jgi:hypothetical protein